MGRPGEALFKLRPRRPGYGGLALPARARPAPLLPRRRGA